MFWSFAEFAEAYLAVASAILLLAFVSFIDRVIAGVMLFASGEHQRGWTEVLKATYEIRAGLARMTTAKSFVLAQILLLITKRDGSIDTATVALTTFANIALVKAHTTITYCCQKIKHPNRCFPSYFALLVAKIVLICIHLCLGATRVVFRQLVRVQWFSWYCLVVALYIFQASNSEGLSLEEWQKPHNAKYVWAIIVEVIISLCCILEPFIPYYILTKYCGFHIPMSPYVQKSIARWKRVGIFAQKSKERLRNMKQLSCQFYIHIRDQFQRRTAAFLVLLTSSRIFWYFVFRLVVASVYAMLTR